ncbi:MAG: glycosyltransferase [Candidatus Woesearchaeota archaeon]
MKKLNILFVCDALTHYTSGSMVSALRFAEGLKERGHKVIFIAAQQKDKEKIDYHKGIKIYRFLSLTFTKRNFPFIVPIKKNIKNILTEEKIDIVHIIDPTPASILCIKVAKSLGIKTVAHAHLQPEALCLYVPKILQPRIINHLIYKYLIWIYKKVDAVICPSDFGKSMLRRYNQKIPFFVISNGVKLSEFKIIDTLDYIKKYNFSKKDKRILYVGRLDREKSVHSLIESMTYIQNKVKNVKLDIVGSGDLRIELEKLAKKIGVRDRVNFLGKLPNSELLMVYNTCDIFVLPSVAELEGMVVLEAMACGKPIVVSNSKLSASSGLVQDNGFVFQLHDPKDLAEKILTLLMNEKIRKRMINKSIQEIKKYDLKLSITKLEKVYYSII